MNPFNLLLRPEYCFNPVQIWRRLMRRRRVRANCVVLAWGLPVRVVPTCRIGIDIVNCGVFDPVVPQAIYQLLDSGEHAIDVGANIGQNTSIMALAAGPRGKVIAFEPHPELWSMLNENVARWRQYEIAPIELRCQAVSASAGRAPLYEPRGFEVNRGAATLTHTQDDRCGYEVELTTMDAVVPPGVTIGVAKLDVEGHEPAVLAGASGLIRERRIRDIVFEDLDGTTARLCAEAGYDVFALHGSWAGARLIPWRSESSPNDGGWPSNYLATLAPERARGRIRPLGWSCLRRRPRRASHPT